MAKLTHIDESGAARMVNVGAKPRNHRRAVARGEIHMSAEAFTQLLAGTAAKGDVLAVARVAGIMAAKRTSELIPLCHNVPLAAVQVDLEPNPRELSVLIEASVENIDRTGVEMEALTAVSVAALTIYDMLKAVDREMRIGGIHLAEKSGGTHAVSEAVAIPSLTPPPAPVVHAPSVSVVPKGATVPGLFPPPELMRPTVGVVPRSEPRPSPVPAPHPPVVAPNPVHASATPVPVHAAAVHAAAVHAAAVHAAAVHAAPVHAAAVHAVPDLPVLRAPDAARHRGLAAAELTAHAARVRELSGDELALVRDFLIRDRFVNAYLLGDLDQPYAEHCKWHALPSTEPEGLEGVVLLYNGLSMPAVLTAGSPEAVQALMVGARTHLPRRFYCHIHADHREAVEAQYTPRAWTEMIRMGLRRDELASDASSEGTDRLSHADTAAIMQLYRHYPDNFFDPAQLDTGLYFGVRENGELVSVAGVHVVSPAYDVAVIGNIVTHTEQRGRGLASRCVSRLLEAIFAQVSHVALNVQIHNEAAIACYQKFGFRERSRCLEGWVLAR